tara:strand:- start:153 stop:635 length:483 start_codon:yes stop_codon:yes gene_type:complete
MTFITPSSPSRASITPFTSRLDNHRLEIDKHVKKVAKIIKKEYTTADLIEKLEGKFKVPFRKDDQVEADGENQLRIDIKNIINKILNSRENELIKELIETIKEKEIKELPCIDVLNIIFYDPENTINMLRRPLTSDKLNNFLSSSSTTPNQSPYNLRKRI